MALTGRPKRGAEIGADALLTIRLPADLKRKIQAMAAVERRSMTAQIRVLLERDVEAPKKKGRGHA
jgi:predicted transcriptional regulator